MASTTIRPADVGVRAPRVRLRALAPDSRLLAWAQEGDRDAFAVLFDRHHGDLLAFARHMLGDRDEAEDVVQHAFAQAWSALGNGKRMPELRPWLFVVARHRCIDVLRRRPTHELDTAAGLHTDGLADIVGRRSDLRELLGDLERLPEQQRAALLLAELRGLSHDDVAAVLDCRPAQVKALVFQARSNLMAQRDARASDCAQIREQLSVLRGGSLLRGPLRRHLRGCVGCQDFQARVRAQRRQLALLLPVTPTAGLRAGTLHSAVGISGGGAAVGTGTGSAAVIAAAMPKAIAALVTGLAVVGAATGVHALTPQARSHPARQPIVPSATGVRQPASGGQRASGAIASGRGRPAAAHPGLPSRRAQPKGATAWAAVWTGSGPRAHRPGSRRSTAPVRVGSQVVAVRPIPVAPGVAPAAGHSAPATHHAVSPATPAPAVSPSPAATAPAPTSTAGADPGNNGHGKSGKEHGHGKPTSEPPGQAKKAPGA